MGKVDDNDNDNGNCVFKGVGGRLVCVCVCACTCACVFGEPPRFSAFSVLEPYAGGYGRNLNKKVSVTGAGILPRDSLICGQ